MNSDARIESAADFIFKWGGFDGAHHKQWVLDQVLRKLLSDAEYDEWVGLYRGENLCDDPEYDVEYEYEWDEGIAP